MERLEQLKQQITQGIQASGFLVRRLRATDKQAVQQLLIQYGQSINDEYFDLILSEMENNKRCSVYYVVILDKQERALGLGSFFYEDKFTRGGCCAIHMNDIYTDKKSLSKQQQAEIEVVTVESLSNIAFRLRDTYKASLHVASGTQHLYKPLNYEPVEKHMSRVTAKHYK